MTEHMTSYELFIEYMSALFKEKRLVGTANNIQIVSEVMKDVNKLQANSPTPQKEEQK